MSYKTTRGRHAAPRRSSKNSPQPYLSVSEIITPKSINYSISSASELLDIDRKSEEEYLEDMFRLETSDGDSAPEHGSDNSPDEAIQPENRAARRNAEKKNGRNKSGYTPRHRVEATPRDHRYAVVLSTAVLCAGAVALGVSGLPDSEEKASAAELNTIALQRANAPSSVDEAEIRAIQEQRAEEIARISRKQRDEAAMKKAASQWIRPAPGVITSKFGGRDNVFGASSSENHPGVDMRAPVGTAVRAVHGGTVIFAGWKGGYGYAVVIDHGDGLTSLYGHNKKTIVRAGDVVKPGTIISRSGNTGRSTGAHVHFELRVDDVAINPMPYLEVRGLDLNKPQSLANIIDVEDDGKS